jgi:hypothetical protein
MEPMIFEPYGTPFFALPVMGVRQSFDDVGPDDELFYLVVRYLDSSPVVLTLGTPVTLPGGRIRRSYRTDGISLWDNITHDDAVSGQGWFSRELVERAVRNDGVCTPVSGEILDEAVAQVLLENAPVPVAEESE